MPPDVPLPGSPEDWMRFAHSDLELARAPIVPKVLLESLCYHAQQAAEKALKAVLISLHIEFPRTHNIRTLPDLLPADIPTSTEILDAARLIDYAVLSRYPGYHEPIEEAEYQEAVNLAEYVVTWAEKLIKKAAHEGGILIWQKFFSRIHPQSNGVICRGYASKQSLPVLS